MVDKYIKNAINDVDKLIELTLFDIKDVQKAHHDKITKRVKEKNYLTVSFETNKSLLNDELQKMVNNTQKANISEILSDEQKILLEELKNKLNFLKEKNREYAKYIVRLNEFYTSLFDEMFNFDRDGYKISHAKPASIMEVSA